MAEDEVSAVQKDFVDFAVVLNQASFDKFLSRVRAGGSIIVNSSLAKISEARKDIKYIVAPITEMSEKTLGSTKMANILSLGILAKISGLISVETLTKALNNVIPAHRKNLIPKNIEALNLGYEYDLLKV